MNQFVDLCTLANVSVLMFDEHLRGYYLHAKAPWQKSDIPLDWLQTRLHEELSGKGNLPSRGLRVMHDRVASRNNEMPVQTYQIYLPMNLRRKMLNIRTGDHSAAVEKEMAEKKKGSKEKGKKVDGDEPGETDPLQGES